MHWSEILNYVGFLRTFGLRQEVCSYPPLTLYVEPTNVCNLDCPMCPHAIMNRTKGSISPELFRKVVEDLRPAGALYVGKLVLHFLGEPLLHPELPEMIAYARSRGINVHLSTNGTALSESTSARLIESRLGSIRISFDGATKETYEMIRRGARYELTLQNIVRLLDLRKEMKSRTPVVDLQIIDMCENTNEIGHFGTMFRELGVDTVTVRRFDSWAGAIRLDSNGRVKRTPCSQPWRVMVVYWNGEVSACCRDYDGRYVIGNVTQEHLLKIWNGIPIRRLRRAMMEGHIQDLDLCKKCDDVGMRSAARAFLECAGGLLFHPSTVLSES